MTCRERTSGDVTCNAQIRRRRGRIRFQVKEPYRATAREFNVRFTNPLFTFGPSADPGVFVDGGVYYAVATSSPDAFGHTIAIRSSSDLSDWRDDGRLLESIPAWADEFDSFWAPQVYYLPAIQSYVAYYAAVNVDTGRRCIGRAVAAHLYDAFVDDGSPLCAPFGLHSLIDASLFIDGTQHYILYKEDPEGSGKRIVLRTVPPSGALQGDQVGEPVGILAPTQAWERLSVEAPTMIKFNGSYYLFYSGGQFDDDSYGVGVARAPTPYGPFVGSPAPILSGANSPAFCGVGHQDITWTAAEGWLIFYHAYLRERTDQRPAGCNGDRYLMMDRLYWNAPKGLPTVNDGSPRFGAPRVAP